MCLLYNISNLLTVFPSYFQPKSAVPAHKPRDPFSDEEVERLQVEALAKKFENKYVSFCFRTFTEVIVDDGSPSAGGSFIF